MRDLIGTVLDAARGSKGNGRPPVPYSGRATVTGATWYGARTGDREAQAAAMSANGTLYSIVGGIALSVSQAEWKLWQEAKSGRREDRTEVSSHASIDFWRQPNPFMAEQLYVEIAQQHLELTGENWNVIVRAMGLPIEGWPVSPHRMAPVPDRDRFIARYEYASPDGEKVPLEVRDVELLRAPNPADIMRGLGAVQAIGIDLDTARNARVWNRAFFENSAEPGGVIETEERLGDEEFNEFRDRWAEAHRGVSNAHRVAILEGGMKWIDRKYTMRDMQFVELLGLSRESIREAYRYPVSMLGESKDVNRAVAAAQEYIYAKHIVVPRLDRWKGMRNKLLRAYGPTAKGLVWDYESPVPADEEADNAERTSKATAAKTYVDAGWDGDVVADALDLPEQLKTGWKKPEPPAPPPGLAPADGKAPAKKVPDAQWSGLVGRLTRRPLNQWEIRASVDLDQLQEDWENTLDRLVAAWRPAAARQRDSVADQIRRAVVADDAAAFAGISVDSAEGSELLAEALGTMALLGAESASREADAQGVSVQPVTPPRQRTLDLADATSRLLASGLATAGGREGLRRHGYSRSPEQVAEEVTAYLQGLSDAPLRAQLGGALTWAQNLGRLGTFGAVPGGRYFASEVLDTNTCGPCRRIDEQELPSFEAASLAYGGGGYLLCEGGIRCRGTVITVWDDPDLANLLARAAPTVVAFDPEQPRDDRGRWSHTGHHVGIDMLDGDDIAKLADGIVGDAQAHEYPSGRAGPRGDERLRQICERQGFDGKPRLVSREELNSYLKDEPYSVELHRGVQDGWDWVEMAKPGREMDDIALPAAEMNERFRTGDLHYGTGQFGNGTYTSTDASVAREYAGEDGALLRMALDPEATVISYQDLLGEQEQFLDQFPDDSPVRRAFGDPGRYAAARGYDVITASGKYGSTEYNILNRTALIVERA